MTGEARVERCYRVTDKYDDAITLNYQEAWTLVGVYEDGHDTDKRVHGDLIMKWGGPVERELLTVHRRDSSDLAVHVWAETVAELRAELESDVPEPKS